MKRKKYNIKDSLKGYMESPVYLTPYWQPLMEGRDHDGYKVPFGFLRTNLRFWVKGLIEIADAIIPIVSLGFIRSSLTMWWLCLEPSKNPKLSAFNDWLSKQGI